MTRDLTMVIDENTDMPIALYDYSWDVYKDYPPYTSDIETQTIELKLDDGVYLSDVDKVFVIVDLNEPYPDIIDKLFLDRFDAQKYLAHMVSFWYPDLLFDLADELDRDKSYVELAINYTDSYNDRLNVKVVPLEIHHYNYS